MQLSGIMPNPPEYWEEGRPSMAKWCPGDELSRLLMNLLNLTNYMIYIDTYITKNLSLNPYPCIIFGRRQLRK